MLNVTRIWIAAAATGMLAFGTANAQDGGTAAPAPIRHLTECPENIADFIDSDATATLVKKCLGKPAFENRRPDGAFSWVYSLRDGKVAMAFAFNPDGSLMRARAYAKD